MNQIPEHFLIELNKMLNAELYNNKKNESVLEEMIPAIDTVGTLMYIYDYTIQKCFILNGDINSILGHRHFLNGDLFKLAYEISNSKEVDTFLKNINQTMNTFYTTNKNNLDLKTLRFSFEYKAKRIRGDYAWLAHQMNVLSVDHNGNTVTSLNVITDITEFKRDDKMHFMISKKDNDQLYTSLIKLTDKKTSLSQRELEILNLLKIGKSSLEISAVLNISEHTVKQHRKNMLQKLNAKNTAELLSKEAA
ncbi:MAG TPA: helix-turn-helix transcriptional regulator [Cytophagaceae bacterium]|jgi:DNA-binding CsgD family transcriptional regulator|nr:helix-turn-helix transcriptional regulator [Cytophagaceae bacterium]